MEHKIELSNLLNSVLASIATEGLGEIFSSNQPYRGFDKWRIKFPVLEKICKEWGYDARKFQIEIVTVMTDLSAETHYHGESEALIKILGKEHGCENPHNAYIYLDNKWQQITEPNSCFEFPKSYIHGFAVNPLKHGTLSFVSIQTPEIIRPEEVVDDYVLVSTVTSPPFQSN